VCEHASDSQGCQDAHGARFATYDTHLPDPSPSVPASCCVTDLGFYVAVDGALRLPRGLPSAALITFAPPGSFYQVGVTEVQDCMWHGHQRECRWQAVSS
jgi:hypothetical protein